MKYLKLTVNILIVIIVLSFVSCEVSLNHINGSGVTSDVSYNLNNFNKISASDGCELSIEKSETFFVEVTIDENLKEYLDVYVEGKTLYVGLKNSYSYHNKHFKATIKLPDIYNIDLSGGCICNIIGGFDLNHSLNFSQSGGAIINGKINCTSSEIDLSGGAKVTLEGKAESVSVSSSGGSIVDLLSFPVNNCDVDISGGCILSVNVTSQLNINASGGSIIKYKGSPKIGTLNISGGSQLIRI